MANYDKLTARVLHGLERCGMDPTWREDCGDCPYLSDDDDEIGCVARLARDARTIILHQDQLLQQIEGGEAP